MRAAFVAGIAYFGAVFAAGLLLGVARVLAAEPKMGEVAAVLIELPLILAFAWWACRILIERLRIERSAASGVTMGATAFLLLMAAETGLALWTPGRSAAEILAQYRAPAPLLGLLGQLGFAFFPFLQLARAPAPREGMP